MKQFFVRISMTLLFAACVILSSSVRAATTPSHDEIVTSIGRGVQFLIERQEPNGGWGSPRNSKRLNIYAPGEAHSGYRAGTTALALASLIETEDAIKKGRLTYNALGITEEQLTTSIERGETWLLERLPQLRRSSLDVLYNIWGHAYGIQCLARMLNRFPDDAERCGKIRAQIRFQIERLAACEAVYGGWFYYEDDPAFQHIAKTTACFVTATVLVALREAADCGIEVPEDVVRRGVSSIVRQRFPDFTYAYGDYTKGRPRRDINRAPGSLGRSQACNLALRLWGDEKVTDTVVAEWLQRLSDRNGWLDVGRKRPVPHESFYQVAGYFFYYGHYYAALCIDLLPEPQRPHFRELLATILVPLQEKDGSWWDYPLYDYHQQYGTAYAVMSLLRTI
ncbi:MAG: hypothetical protein ACRC46_04100 [Thermoguttaceae bacterium]